MRRSRVRFALLTLAITVILFAASPLVVFSLGRGRHVFLGGQYLVPVLAVIAAAAGVGWKRKARYLVIALAGFGVLDALFALTGVQQTAWSGVQWGASAWASTATLAYQAFRIAYPMTVLLVFVGGKPERVWGE